MSEEGFQERFTWDEEIAVAVRFVGVDGGWVSAGFDVEAGVGDAEGLGVGGFVTVRSGFADLTSGVPAPATWALKKYCGSQVPTRQALFQVVVQEAWALLPIIGATIVVIFASGRSVTFCLTSNETCCPVQLPETLAFRFTFVPATTVLEVDPHEADVIEQAVNTGAGVDVGIGVGAGVGEEATDEPVGRSDTAEAAQYSEPLRVQDIITELAPGLLL